MKRYFLGFIAVCLLMPAVCFADVEIVVTIPETTYLEIAEAFADVYGYQGSSDPQSKVEFAKEEINKYIENVWIAHKANEADVTKKDTVDSAKVKIKNKLKDIKVKEKK